MGAGIEELNCHFHKTISLSLIIKGIAPLSQWFCQHAKLIMIAEQASRQQRFLRTMNAV
jgi:hypothetical protein